jgi:hypothetical protein
MGRRKTPSRRNPGVAAPADPGIEDRIIFPVEIARDLHVVRMVPALEQAVVERPPYLGEPECDSGNENEQECPTSAVRPR